MAPDLLRDFGAFLFLKTMTDFIKMGEAFHPHGIKGEVELRVFNSIENDSSLSDGAELLLKPLSEKSKLNSQGELWKISKLRFGNKVICLLEGIKDRTHLESLLPFEFFLKREEFEELDEGEFYLVDVVGFEVFSPTGELLGVLENFDDNGEQYLFNVRLKDGSILTLPYVDVFFPEIRFADKKIIMNMPEYTE